MGLWGTNWFHIHTLKGYRPMLISTNKHQLSEQALLGVVGTNVWLWKVFQSCTHDTVHIYLGSKIASVIYKVSSTRLPLVNHHTLKGFPTYVIFNKKNTNDRATFLQEKNKWPCYISEHSMQPTTVIARQCQVLLQVGFFYISYS